MTDARATPRSDRSFRASFVFMLLLAPLLTMGATIPPEGEQFADLDLATLMTMDVTVTSAARHEQPSSVAAAAVYVITRDDIRRSGATSVPEALRGVPGLQVARISTRAWSVTARGFGTRFANKLLVLVDGRSIYNALFSGVMWEEQPIVLDNIDRIEVVRGPGGALWGMNAVNGVINIITRHAAESPGMHVEANAGANETNAIASYAGEHSALGAYRFHVGRGEIDSYDGNDTPLDRDLVGVRIDRASFGGDLMFSADYSDSDFSAYDGLHDSSYPRYASTGSTLLDWRRPFGVGDVEVRGFHEWIDRSDPGSWDETTTGLETQFTAARRGVQLWSVGAGWRRVADEQRGVIPSLRLAHRSTEHQQWSVYAQDELYFHDDKLRLIAGAKLEDFDVGDLAFQPTLRGIWRYSDAHTLWAAASRALRAPSRFELQSNVETLVGLSPPTYYVLVGDEGLKEEELQAYEIGWRWRATRTLSVDVALYRNTYSSLIGVYQAPPLVELGPPLRLYAPRLNYANLHDADASGVEVAAEWQATSRIRLQANGVFADVNADGEVLYLAKADGVTDPKRSFSLQARFDLPRNAELDLAWRYVDALPGHRISAYDALDVQAAWALSRTLKLSLTLENALGGAHREFHDELSGGPGVTLERSYLLRAIWRSQR